MIKYPIFYRVKTLVPDFIHLKFGDIVMIGAQSHHQLVKIASATEKTKHWGLTTEGFYIDGRKITHLLEPLKICDIIDIYPHLTKRIKAMDANQLLSRFLPEMLCEQCIEDRGLINEEKWERNIINTTCRGCQTIHDGNNAKRCFFASALRPADTSKKGIYKSILGLVPAPRK